jgi:hypothetical protein
MLTKRRQQYAVLEKIFDLYFVKGLRFDVIYLNRHKNKEYEDFLRQFCTTVGKFPYEMIEEKGCYEVLEKAFVKKATQTCYSNPKLKKKMDDWKHRRSVGEGYLNPINEVVFSETKQDVVFDENGNELVTTTTKEITQKRIERIEFHSPSTIDAMKIAEKTQQLTSEYFDDLVAKLEGREPKKHQFVHLDIAGKVKKKAMDMLEMMDKVLEGEASEEDMKDINKASAQINKFIKIADGIRKMETQPIYIMNLMHETGRNRQTEISQAIMNDRQMLDYGNVILQKDQKLVSDSSKIRNEIREKGYLDIDELLVKNLQNVGGYIEQEQQVENITDEEIVEEVSAMEDDNDSQEQDEFDKE